MRNRYDLFVQQYNLKTGDRIVLPKSNLGWIQHHVIYYRDKYNRHMIIENKDGVGVRIISLEELLKDIKTITRFERFSGSNQQRIAAMDRAFNKLGTRYDLANFNCEHFCNYVQYEKSKSHQIGNVGKGLFAIGAIFFL